MAKDRDKDRDKDHETETEAVDVLDTDTGNSALDNELKEAAHETRSDDDEPRFGWIEYDGQKFGVRRRAGALIVTQVAASQRRRDGVGLMIATEALLRHTLGPDYIDFEAAFNAHEYDDLEDEFEALVEITNAIQEALSGRPKDSPTR